ncbi:ABC-2 family transporter protein [Deinococcus sp.]|uniref:ABC-2 family transporter protein n=1 Tax=Deinococcus sp. TaxID=47478 RepID=UPI0025B7ECEC|nr:ABC-2 family transporter protein [Deinococcus sp.]
MAGYSLTDAVTYSALTQAFVVALALFGWTDFMRTIHRGEVGTDLLRPMNLLGFWAAQDAGRAAAQFVLRGLPMLLTFQVGAAFQGGAAFQVGAAGTVGGLHWPAGPLAWTQTILSAAPPWACGFLFRFLVNCAAFWFPDAAGFGRFAWALLGPGCGFLMPLAFFPEWAQAALACAPFPSMLSTTVEVWLGCRSGPGAWVAPAPGWPRARSWPGRAHSWR